MAHIIAPDKVSIKELKHTRRYGYVYDALGRRFEKRRLDKDSQPYNRTRFMWDGLRMLEETSPIRQQSLYLYTDVNSYEPMARIDRNANQEQHFYYYYINVNVIPEELADKTREII